MPETPPLVVEPIRPVDPWQPIADALMRHPLEWHPVDGHRADTVATTNITRGVLAAFRPAGCYEAMRREGRLFIRYLGNMTEQAARVGAALERGL